MKIQGSHETADPGDKSKVSRIGPISISLLLHLAFLLIVGGAVIIEQIIPKNSFQGAILDETSETTLDVTTPPDEVIPDDGAPESPDLSMEPTVNQTAASLEKAMDVLAVENSASPSSWKIMAGPSVTGIGKVGGGIPGGTGGTGTGTTPRLKNPFGNPEHTPGSLEGIFYDLKQTKGRKSTEMNPQKYLDVIREFEKKNWNPQVLKDFYRGAEPMYATQLYIPMRDAIDAPKAFKVEKEVQPALWIIVYDGSFRVPATKRYRFAGYADDVLLVRINGETVLDGSLLVAFGETTEQTALTKIKDQTVEKTQKVGNGCMIYSKWMEFDKDTVQKIQVLLGERPGGLFGAFLMVEVEGQTYEKEPSGRPVLPLFQLAKNEQDFSAEIAAGNPPYAETPVLMNTGN